MLEIPGKYTTAKVMVDAIEPECLSQIYSFINHPAFTNPVAVMPDTHAGAGAVIGFTMPMSEKLIPNVIGVDIACGMLSVNVGRSLLVSHDVLDKYIRDRVPFGKSVHEQPAGILEADGQFWLKVNVLATEFSARFCQKFSRRLRQPLYDYSWFLAKCKQIGMDPFYAECSVGTLGGGNHFIEFGKSGVTGDIWVTIHTGSRNLGKKICDYWQKKAYFNVVHVKNALLRQEVQEIKKKAVEDGDPVRINREIMEARARLGLDNRASGLEYLDGDEAAEYLFDMLFCQQYACLNRWTILDSISPMLFLSEDVESIETLHNFVDFNDFIIRKGAIRSYEGDQMIIPLNMRDGILLCTGKSNSEWNYSAPHGAGRAMKRSQAKQNLNLEEFRKSMEGIFSTSVNYGTLDESPQAYKDSGLIVEAIMPTAYVVDVIRPIHNLKGSSEAEE